MPAGSYGAHPVAYGLETLFTPWFFNGSTVYWAEPHGEFGAALAVAAAIAAGASQGRFP